MHSCAAYGYAMQVCRRAPLLAANGHDQLSCMKYPRVVDGSGSNALVRCTYTRCVCMHATPTWPAHIECDEILGHWPKFQVGDGAILQAGHLKSVLNFALLHTVHSFRCAHASCRLLLSPSSHSDRLSPHLQLAHTLRALPAMLELATTSFTVPPCQSSLGLDP